MPPSLPARLITAILRVTGFRKLVERQVKKPIPRSTKPFMPARMARAYDSQVVAIAGHAVATFAPRDSTPGLHLVFFHGGAYVFEAAGFHWTLAEKLVQALGCRMTLVDYPLAPEYAYRETFAMVEAAYAHLQATFPSDTFAFIGDSAGGGLALAFTQKLAKEASAPLPQRLILLSPWLDLSMSNPAAQAQAATDQVLTLEMLRHAGRLYAGGDDPQQYLLSPLRGDLAACPPTLVLYGTEELFYADCRALAQQAQATGAPFTFHEYAGMQHDWGIFPIPERAQVVADIVAFVQGGG